MKETCFSGVPTWHQQNPPLSARRNWQRGPPLDHDLIDHAHGSVHIATLLGGQGWKHRTVAAHRLRCRPILGSGTIRLICYHVPGDIAPTSESRSSRGLVEIPPEQCEANSLRENVLHFPPEPYYVNKDLKIAIHPRKSFYHHFPEPIPLRHPLKVTSQPKVDERSRTAAIQVPNIAVPTTPNRPDNLLLLAGLPPREPGRDRSKRERKV